MADKRVWFGKKLYTYDNRDSYTEDGDAIEGIRVDEQIRVDTAPTEDEHVLRLGDVASLVGAYITFGLIEDRPAAGSSPRLYLATDENILYYDNDTTWDVVSDDNSDRTILSGILADRPATPDADTYYYATDTALMYRYFGGAWANVPQFNGMQIGNFSTRPAAEFFGRTYFAGDRICYALDNGIEWITISCFTYGTLAARPDPDIPAALYGATDEGRLYFCDGSSWISAGGGSGSASSFGNVGVSYDTNQTTLTPVGTSALNITLDSSDVTIIADTLAVTGDISATGAIKGCRELIHWVSAGAIECVSTTPIEIERVPGVKLGWVAHRPGSIVGLSLLYDITSETINTVNLGVYKNGALVWAALVLDADTTGTDLTAQATQARGTDTFVAGDVITLRLILYGLDNVILDNYSACLEVVVDT
jgi:hypothetical protein